MQIVNILLILMRPPSQLGPILLFSLLNLDRIKELSAESINMIRNCAS